MHWCSEQTCINFKLKQCRQECGGVGFAAAIPRLQACCSHKETPALSSTGDALVLRADLQGHKALHKDNKISGVFLRECKCGS